jgi:hypothetical protein
MQTSLLTIDTTLRLRPRTHRTPLMAVEGSFFDEFGVHDLGLRVGRRPPVEEILLAAA